MLESWIVVIASAVGAPPPAPSPPQIPGPTPAAPESRGFDVAHARAAIERASLALPAQESAFATSLRAAPASAESFDALFGYNPPGGAVSLAWLCSVLYEREGRDEDALAAAGFLLRMARLRDLVPETLRSARAEYADGVPAVPNFFLLGDFADAWRRIREAPVPPSARTEVEEAIAGSAEFVLVFPEWGPHNRAMLRAVGLLRAAQALPAHPRARAWRSMAETLAADSARSFEIEDAQVYHPIWLAACLRYAEAAGDARIFDDPRIRYYLRYLAALLSPAGTVPDFGDAWWNGSLGWYVECFERGARALGDPELAWAANRVRGAMRPEDPTEPELSRAVLAARIHLSRGAPVPPRAPAFRSGPVLDDLVGKKVVLRTGVADDDYYLLLNYRDEGGFGRAARDFLRDTLAVEEEKAHHGHADENAIVLLMDRGAVLLHDAGYRDRAPSGPFGAYRSDVFHNRLVVRRGALAEGQPVWEALRDGGAYRAVRTEGVDYLDLPEAGVSYSRTRVVDDDAGYAWDRVLVFVEAARAVLVVDTVEPLRDGAFTLSDLFAVGEVVAEGPDHAVGRTRAVGAADTAPTRDLLLVRRPDATSRSGAFPLTRHGRDEVVLHETRSLHLERGDRVTFATALLSIAPGADPTASAGCVRWVAATADGGVAAAIADDAGDSTLVGVKLDLRRGLRPSHVRPRYDPRGGAVRYGDVETDADVLAVRHLSDGGLRWSAGNVTRVELAGEEVFAARPHQVFQPSGRSDVVGVAKWRRAGG